MYQGKITDDPDYGASLVESLKKKQQFHFRFKTLNVSLLAVV